MLIATFDNAASLYMYGAAILVAGALAVWGLLTVARRHRHDVVVKVLCGLGAFLLGGAGLVIGGVVLLLGVAVNGCPPDAYECPF